MVECDTGRKRAGVVQPEEAVALAPAARDDPWLGFAGLMLCPPEGRMAERQGFLGAVSAGLEAEGMPAGIVSTGGTPNLPTMSALRGATEHRSGTSIFNDRMMMEAGVDALRTAR
jgi:D-serine deaminase-like pyridoxal phosphate-dependent protein